MRIYEEDLGFDELEEIYDEIGSSIGLEINAFDVDAYSLSGRDVEIQIEPVCVNEYSGTYSAGEPVYVLKSQYMDIYNLIFK